VQQASSLKDNTPITVTPIIKAPISANSMVKSGSRITLVGDGKFVLSQDGGQTWTTNFPYQNELWYGEGGRLRVAGNKVFKISEKNLYLSDLNATKFKKVKSEGYCPTSNITAIDDETLAFSTDCGLLLSYDSGRTFYKKGPEEGLPSSYTGDVVTFNGKVFVSAGGGFYGRLSVSDSQGETFTLAASNDNVSISARLGVSSRGVYFSSDNGLFLTADGNASTKVTNKYFSNFAVGSDTIVGSDSYGKITVSKDAGVTWFAVPANPALYANAPARIVTDGQNIYLDATSKENSGAVLVYSHDGGTTFNYKTFLPVPGVTTRITDITLLSGKVYVLTTNGAYVSDNGHDSSFQRIDVGSEITKFNRVVHTLDKVYVEAECGGYSVRCTFMSSDNGLSYKYLWNSWSLELRSIAPSGDYVHGIAQGFLGYSIDRGETFVKSIVPNTYMPTSEDRLRSDGKFVVLMSRGSLYFSKDNGKRYSSWDNTEVDSGDVRSFSLDGGKVLILATNGLYEWDLTANTTILRIPKANLPYYDTTAVWSKGSVIVLTGSYAQSIWFSNDGGLTFLVYKNSSYGLGIVSFSDDGTYFSEYNNIFRI
jgi:photosystem II stability/assembly factor-like uncharacterized protein